MQLGDVAITGRGISTTTVAELFSSSALALPSAITISTPTIIFNGVVAKSGQLVHGSSFVRVCRSDEVILPLLS